VDTQIDGVAAAAIILGSGVDASLVGRGVFVPRGYGT
jgi:hypothetical protein